MRRVVVIGAGHMGSVLIGGIRTNEPDLALSVVEPSEERADTVRRELHVPVHPEYEGQPDDLVILAIPPQAFTEFATQQPAGTFAEATVLSVLAGVSLATLTDRLGTARTLRAMPNIASEVAQGMTVLCRAEAVPDDTLTFTELVLASIGRV